MDSRSRSIWKTLNLYRGPCISGLIRCTCHILVQVVELSGMEEIVG